MDGTESSISSRIISSMLKTSGISPGAAGTESSFSNLLSSGISPGTKAGRFHVQVWIGQRRKTIFDQGAAGLVTVDAG